MNFKVFFRTVLVLVISFMLITGVVAGGIALSHYMFTKGNRSEQPGMDSSDVIPNTEQAKVAKQEVFNVLLLGVDDDGYRTDVIILAQYNIDQNKINMLQIPRDTKILTSRPDKKINSAYAYGKEDEIFRAVKMLVGVDVNKYALVNLDGFRRLVDEIGGVEIDVPINMYYDDPYQNLHIRLKKGKQPLNGEKAEMFVRFRKNNDDTGYPDGDLGRVRAQQQFISAVLDKMLTIQNIIKIPKLISIVVSNVKTNIGLQEMTKYADNLFRLKKDSLEMIQLPGEPTYVNDVSYFICDANEVRKVILENFTPGLKNSGIGMENSDEDNKKENSLRQQDEKQTIQQSEENDIYKPRWRNRFIKIEVLNGSNSDEAAAKVANDLKQKGFNVVRVGEFSGIHYSKTKVIDRTRKGYSKEVSKALGYVETDKDLDTSSGVDVTVIVGSDNDGEVAKA